MKTVIHVHIYRRPVRDAGFVEGDHPRDPDGKFESKGGGGSAGGSGGGKGVGEEGDAPALHLVGHGVLKSAAQRDAFENYTGANSSFTSNEINAHLRGESQGSDAVVAVIREIKSAFKDPSCRLKEPSVLYRGCHRGWADLSKKKPGGALSFPSFVSTSTDMSVAKEFGVGAKDSVFFVISAKAGTPAISPSKAFTGEDFGASEILLDAGSRYRIRGVRQQTHTVFLEAL